MRSTPTSRCSLFPFRASCISAAFAIPVAGLVARRLSTLGAHGPGHDRHSDQQRHQRFEEEPYHLVRPIRFVRPRARAIGAAALLIVAGCATVPARRAPEVAAKRPPQRHPAAPLAPAPPVAAPAPPVAALVAGKVLARRLERAAGLDRRQRRPKSGPPFRAGCVALVASPATRAVWEAAVHRIAMPWSTRRTRLRSALSSSAILAPTR